MSDPITITIERGELRLPVSRDEGGRYLCPHCHTPSEIAEDGRLVCPVGEAQDELVRLVAEQFVDAFRVPSRTARPTDEDVVSAGFKRPRMAR